MNAIISKIKNALRGIVSAGLEWLVNYAVHLFFVFLAAVALHFGFHVSVPVLPTALASMTGLGVLKWVTSELAKSFHLGRLQAQAEKDAEQYVEHLLGPIVKYIGEQPAPKAGATGHDGAHL